MLIELLGLPLGSVVADIGAGDRKLYKWLG